MCCKCAVIICLLFSILGYEDFSEASATKERPAQTSSIMRKIEIPPGDELKTKIQKLDEYQKEVINIGVTYCKDLLKARKASNPLPEAPKVMVHGGAGSGKSTVINILAILTQKILMKAGDNPDCPYVLKAAFTGTAACNIQGFINIFVYKYSFFLALKVKL